MYLRGRISRGHRRVRVVIMHYIYGLMIAEKFCCTYSRKAMAQNMGQGGFFLPGSLDSAALACLCSAAAIPLAVLKPAV